MSGHFSDQQPYSKPIWFESGKLTHPVSDILYPYFISFIFYFNRWIFVGCFIIVVICCSALVVCYAIRAIRHSLRHPIQTDGDIIFYNARLFIKIIYI